jgi:[methyl-Co(III) methanol-specific corrinoid protein]:coenzyme M methyltransferase
MGNQRNNIVSLFNKKNLISFPVFSGLIHITSEGLEREGLSLHEVHHEAGKMARAAASTFKVTRMPSATLPLDLCAPAEALGADLNFYEGGEMQFPQVKKHLFPSTKYLNSVYFQNADFVNKGRMPVICDAIRLMKEDIGNDVVISGMIPGPYTLLLYLIEPGGLFAEMKREPNAVLDALFHLSSFLSQIGHAYRNVGADFITIHDMGGSAGFIGPSKYEQFVFPAEKDLIERLPKPCVLSVCGNMDKSLHLLAQTGADAISVDQLTDLKAAREAMEDTMLFGNIDPLETLLRGDEAGVVEAIQRSKEAGVDAIWPGCDIVPSTPIQNIKAMMP